MDTTLGNFYLQVQFSNLTAVVWIADNSVWRLIECSPDSEWPQMNTWRRGTWKTGDNGMARCYAPSRFMPNIMRVLKPSQKRSWNHFLSSRGKIVA